MRYCFHSILFIWLILPAIAFSQAKKPEVLVYGSGLAGYAAALQSAKSNLHTIWVITGEDLAPEMAEHPFNQEDPPHLHAGIWNELRKSMLDTVKDVSLKDAMEKRIKDFPHLHVIKNTEIRKITARKRNFRITFNDRTRFTVRSVVDATLDASDFTNLGFPPKPTKSPQRDRNAPTHALMRTGVAVGGAALPQAFTVPLGVLIPADSTNLLSLSSLFTAEEEEALKQQHPAFLTHIGQALGASAGFIAFFKTTSDKIDVRQIQGELLQYDARLLPFTDIGKDDPNLQAIQRVAATGLFLNKNQFDQDGVFLFEPDKNVSTAELMPTLNQLYSRSQIWFTDHTSDSMRMKDLLSFIKYVGQRGDELEGLVEKGWSRKFHLSGEYDLNAPVNRRQIAVLMDEYINPFHVKIDFNGNILR